MSYYGIVTTITVRPHPHADRLKLATTLGNQVVVGMDQKDGDIGIFFPPDGRLSDEMLKANDLVARKDEQGNRAGGFFSENGRVRAQKFRQEKSDGYWTPLSSLAWTGVDLTTLKEGDQIDVLGGKLVCEKYYTPATIKAMRSGKGAGKTKRGATIYFPMHFDTPKFRDIAHYIPAGAIITISEKLHGTSGRYGYVLDDLRLPWWKRWVNKLIPVFATRAYRTLNGSRKVILEQRVGFGYYGTDDFRETAVKNISLRKGECIYFEICGYVAGESKIMGDHPVHDPQLKKIYGDHMAYTYGANPGEQVIRVYRITTTNEDGFVTELSWVQMSQRCSELGLAPVPLLKGPFIYDGNEAELRKLVTELTEGPSVMCPKHIREGVVVRVEHEHGTRWAKEKSFHFLELEGLLKNNDNYVDMEEVA